MSTWKGRNQDFKNKERPQDRYNKKNNLTAKTYRLNQDTVTAFREACEKIGVSQAAQLTALMMKFVEKVEKENN